VQPATRKLLRIVLLADLVLFGTAGLVWYAMRPSEEMAELIAKNPGWTVDSSVGWVVMTEHATQRRVVLSPEQTGPYAVRSVPCAEVETAWPTWFRVPGDSSETEPLACVHVAGADLDVYVMNFLTAVPIPQIWDELYEPLVEQAKRTASGGYSMGGKNGQKLARETVLGNAVRAPRPGASGPRPGGQLFYGIDPPPGSPERETRLQATHVGDETLVVASFRKPPP
jgi:hypothetical protein